MIMNRYGQLIMNCTYIDHIKKPPGCSWWFFFYTRMFLWFENNNLNGCCITCRESHCKSSRRDSNSFHCSSTRHSGNMKPEDLSSGSNCSSTSSRGSNRYCFYSIVKFRLTNRVCSKICISISICIADSSNNKYPRRTRPTIITTSCFILTDFSSVTTIWECRWTWSTSSIYDPCRTSPAICKEISRISSEFSNSSTIRESHIKKERK